MTARTSYELFMYVPFRSCTHKDIKVLQKSHCYRPTQPEFTCLNNGNTRTMRNLFKVNNKDTKTT